MILPLRGVFRAFMAKLRSLSLIQAYNMSHDEKRKRVGNPIQINQFLGILIHNAGHFSGLNDDLVRNSFYLFGGFYHFR